MRATKAAGFTLLETLISLTVLLLVMSAVASLLIHNARINKSQQLTVDVQANARNCMSVVVQKLRSAGWNPLSAAFPNVIPDPDTTDAISQIEVFADHDADGLTDKAGEQILIRHNSDRIELRDTAIAAFSILAVDITNDSDGDGIIEPMFTPTPVANPDTIRVQITARSPVPDPVTQAFIRFTLSNEVVLRKSL